jgi:DNA-binding transcriptional regulator YiaG
MKTKTKRDFLYEGFGFPVHIKNAPLILVEGAWALNINQNTLRRLIVQQLATLPSRFTGHQVHFIRKTFGMTLKAFGERFSVAHTAVIGWEKCEMHPTRMNWATEKDIRLAIVVEFGDAHSLAEVYAKMTKAAAEKPMHVFVEHVAA